VLGHGTGGAGLQFHHHAAVAAGCRRQGAQVELAAVGRDHADRALGRLAAMILAGMRQRAADGIERVEQTRGADAGAALLQLDGHEVEQPEFEFDLHAVVAAEDGGGRGRAAAVVVVWRPLHLGLEADLDAGLARAVAAAGG